MTLDSPTDLRRSRSSNILAPDTSVARLISMQAGTERIVVEVVQGLLPAFIRLSSQSLVAESTEQRLPPKAPR